MNLTQAQVLAFHIAGNHLINDYPTIADDKTVELRKALITEEVNELYVALDARDITAIADALADLLYVTYGTAISYGLDMQIIGNAVHESNMTKFGKPGEYAETCDESGKSIKNEIGKTLKPSTWIPPHIDEALRQQFALTPCAKLEYPYLF